MTYQFKLVLRNLRNLRLIERDRAKRAFIDVMIEDQQLGLGRLEDELREAQMTGARNPEFPGDMVGRPNDDFDNDDDTDQDDHKKKP